MASGLVFNLQRYSLHDGPGIRTTVFLKGCPLHCAWCHNPEGIAPGAEILCIESRCVACGTCRTACPLHNRIPGEGPLPNQPAGCLVCGACVAACPTGARQMVGQRYTVKELVRTLLRDRIFYDDSGGGVTFSGGEPLMQPAFLLEALAACRAHGLHAALDTCGFAPVENLLAAARLADLVLFDLKLMDAARHQRFTGVSNGPILENLLALGATGVPLWIRVPVIPGVNDDAANLAAAAAFAARVAGVQQVNLLPWHGTAAPKARRAGRTDSLGPLTPPGPEALESAATWFRDQGLAVKLGG